MTIASDNEFPKIIITEGSAPSSPDAGNQKLYIDSADHKLKLKNSSGTVTAVGSASDYILLQDWKSSGTAGGVFTAGAWQTRTLNTEVYDTGNHATLSSNQFTLDAGTYQILARAPAIKTEEHIAILYNVTDGMAEVIGSSAYAYGGSSSGVDSVIQGRFTIATSKTFEIRHRCSYNSGVGYGWGTPNTFTTNIYTSVELWKVA